MKKRATTLITSPLAWQMADAPAPHPCIPVLAERGGTPLRTPRATVLVDTREQNPFDLSRFGWFAGVEKKALTVGDYSIAGLEDVCVVERKNLSDLVRSLTTARASFVSRLKKMSAYPHKLLVITAALSSVKSVLAGWGVPFVCTETHELGGETVASYSVSSAPLPLARIQRIREMVGGR